MKLLIAAVLAISSSLALAEGLSLEDVENFDFDPRSGEERAADAEIKARYKDAIVIDFLIPGSPQSYVDPTIKGYEEMADMSIAGGVHDGFLQCGCG